MSAVRPTTVSVSCDTGEETVRPMTDAEYRQWQTDQDAAAAAAAQPAPPTLADQIAAAVSAGVAAAIPTADAAAVETAALDSFAPAPTTSTTPITA